MESETMDKRGLLNYQLKEGHMSKLPRGISKIKISPPLLGDVDSAG
jgi:hypothetical protein